MSSRPRIRELLQAFPQMPATVIAERVGWTRSIRTLSARVAQLRPVYLPPDPAGRTVYAAGELAQNDFWFPDVVVPVGLGQSRSAKQLPVLTMVSGYSRWMSAVLVPSRAAPDLFAGWWQLISALGAVPRLLVWDGEGAVGRYRRGESELTAECQAFRGTLATRVYVCAPRDPAAKGLVERANGYLETSFLPGRSFTSPQDFNAQLQTWLALVNTRRRRALGCSPTQRVTADRTAMLALPPVAPAVGWRTSQRLPRDHYVRVDGNDYSVHPVSSAVGSRLRWTLNGSGSGARAAWSPTTPESGQSTRPCPIPNMWPPGKRCGHSGSDWSDPHPSSRSSSATSPTTTASLTPLT